MKLEELKRLNEKRDQGGWRNLGKLNIPGDSNFRLQIGPTIWPMNENNADFIVAIANAAPALIAVAEAAKYIDDNLGHWFLNPDGPGELKAAMHDLTAALAALETSEDK